MLGISFSELCIVLLIVIVFIPPKELPKLTRFGLKLYQKAQQLYYQLLREINLFGP